MAHEKYTPLVVVVVLLIPIPTQHILGVLLLQAVGLGVITLFLQLLVLQTQVLAVAARHNHT
jgi:hypothetical protein